MRNDLIREGSNGRFTKNPLTMSSSSASSLFPFISYFETDRHVVVNQSGTSVTFYTYYKPKPDSDSPYSHNVSDVMRILVEYARVINVSLRRFAKVEDSVDKRYPNVFVGKGYITDNKGRLLLCLCTNKPSYRNDTHGLLIPDNYYPEEHNARAYEQFTLLVANEFSRKPEYKEFFEEINKRYIQELGEADVEIRYLSSAKMESLCYSNDYKFEFNSVDSLLNYQDFLRSLINNMNRVNFINTNPSLEQSPLPMTYEEGDVQFGILQTVSAHEYRESTEDYWYRIEHPPRPVRIPRNRRYQLIDDTEEEDGPTVNEMLQMLDAQPLIPNPVPMQSVDIETAAPGIDGTTFQINLSSTNYLGTAEGGTISGVSFATTQMENYPQVNQLSIESEDDYEDNYEDDEDEAPYGDEDMEFEEDDNSEEVSDLPY